MSVGIVGQNFYGSTINVPSGAYYIISSSLSTQPNFFLEVQVVSTSNYFADGTNTKVFYLYPHPTTNRMYLHLDFLKTLFYSNFIHDRVTNSNNGIAYVSHYEAPAKVKQVQIKMIEHVGDTVYSPVSTYKTLIYTNTDKYAFYEQYKPFINNKIYIHDNVYPVIRQRLDYYSMNGNLYINFFDANGNLIDTPVNQSPIVLKDLLYFLNPTINPNLNNTDRIQVISILSGDVYEYNYKVYRICQPMGIYVYFLNSRGGLESFWMPTFNLNVTNVKRADIMTARTITNPSYDGIDIEMVSFFKNFATTGTQTITAETYLLDEYDALALQDLVISPFIMIQFLEDPYKENSTENPYYEAVLVDTNYVVNNYRKNKFTTKTFTFKIKRLYR